MADIYPSVFGAARAVIMVNLALKGAGHPTQAEYNAGYPVASALPGSDADEYGYAEDVAAPYKGMSATNFSSMVLTNLLGNAPTTELRDAVAAYLVAATTAKWGTVAYQLGILLSNLVDDGTFGADASDWNAAVTASYTAVTGGAPGGNYSFTSTNPETLMGTDLAELFKGTSSSYQHGDAAHGGGGYDTLQLDLNGAGTGVYDNVTVTGIERLEINLSQTVGTPVRVDVTQFDEQLDIISVSNKSQNTLTVFDIQEDSSNSIDVEIHDSTSDVTLAYDAQAINGAANLVKVSVEEFTGGLTVQDDTASGSGSKQVVETLELNDKSTLGFESTLKFVTNVTGGKTLNIVGGTAGVTFTITNPLDAQLTTIGAGTFAGDLVLDATATATKTLINLGTGNDKLNMGDQFGTGDTIDGGSRTDNDSLTFNFTTSTDGNRAPIMSGVETLNGAFNAPVSLWLTQVDDLKTLNLTTSSDRASVWDADLDFATVNVSGNLAAGAELHYGAAVSFNEQHNLAFNIVKGASTIGDGGASSLQVTNASSVAVTVKGGETGVADNVVFTKGIVLDATGSAGSADLVTTNFAITNESEFDLTVLPLYIGNWPFYSVLSESNTVKTLTLETKGFGDINVGLALVNVTAFDPQLPGLVTTAVTTPYAFMQQARDLEAVTFKTAPGGNITVGLIGDRWVDDQNETPMNLRNVTISVAAGSGVESYGIDADASVLGGIDMPSTAVLLYSPSVELWEGQASNIQTISITAGSSSHVHLFGSDSFLWSLAVTRGVVVGDQGDQVAYYDTRSQSQPLINDVNPALTLPVAYNWLQADTVNNMNVALTGASDFLGGVGIDMFDNYTSGIHMAFEDLVGMDLSDKGNTSVLTVSGSSGYVPGFFFEDEAFNTINATGLNATGTNQHYVNLNSVLEVGDPNVSGVTYNVDARGLMGFKGPNGGLANNNQQLTSDENLYDFAIVMNDPENRQASEAVTFNLGVNDDIVHATNNNDTINGGGGSDLLFGYGGSDVINGGAGNDILFGDYQPLFGEETVIGNGANDTLIGGAGNDILVGGAARGAGATAVQTLWGDDASTTKGQGGTDAFAFVFDDAVGGSVLPAKGGQISSTWNEAGRSTANSAHAVIMDFETGRDVIQIDIPVVPAPYSIAYFYAQDEWAVFNNLNPVHVVLRRGTYNAGTGQFSVALSTETAGDDWQMLLSEDGLAINPALLVTGPGLEFNKGGESIQQAATTLHEIILVGAAAQNGSITQADIAFV